MSAHRTKLKIKKGDTVEMLTGKDRGKRGRVLEVLARKHRLIVEGLNMARKHQKPRKAGQKGEIITLPRAVDISNVMLICPSCAKATRVAFSRHEGQRMRVCRKCKNEFI